MDSGRQHQEAEVQKPGGKRLATALRPGIASIGIKFDYKSGKANPTCALVEVD